MMTAVQDVFANVSIWVIALALAAVLGVVQTYRSYRRLAHIPGPWVASVSPFWIFYQACQSRLIFKQEELHNKYGPLVRISTDQISVSDPDLLKIVYSSGSPFTRGYWFDGVRFDPREDHVFSIKDKATHAVTRAKLQPGYLGKDGQDFEADVDPRVVELVYSIRHNYVKPNKTFDFAPLAGFFALDSLSKIAFGNEIGFLKENKDIYDYFKLTEPFLKVMELTCDHPVLRLIFNVIKKFASPSAADSVGLGAVIGKAQEAVADRFKPDHDLKHASDMLSSFKRRGVTQLECEAESMIQIIAGTDTTASAIRTFFICMVSNPLAYAKLNAETAAAVAEGNVSYPVIKNREALALSYLQACIKESFRWYNPANGLRGKQVPAEGFTYNNVFFPGGTQLAGGEYAMLRRKDIFGHDSDTFRPERWLECADPEHLHRMEHVLSFGFGHGPTACVGKVIALLEVNKAAFELFRNFDFQLVNPLAGIHTLSNGQTTQTGIIVRAYDKTHA